MKSPKKIYDPIRCVWLEALPEEVVRQKLLVQMLDKGFPKSLLVVEAGLNTVCSKKAIPTNRRLDILAFSSSQQGLQPLLLIECKAVFSGISSSFWKKALQQLSGYNNRVQAPFIAVAGPNNTFFLSWRESTGIKNIDYLPNYMELKKACKR